MKKPDAALGSKKQIELSQNVTDVREHRILDASITIGGLQGRVFDLLEAIDETGSLVAASKQAGLSYKGAWDMIERAALLSPRPLIERNSGGGNDRGTRLTETGRGLLSIHRRLETKKRKIVRELNREFASDPILLQWYRGLILRSSTRNQWIGEIVEVKEGVVNAIVTVRLPSGAQILSHVSRSFQRELRWEKGTPVIAVVKAPMVHLLSDVGDYDLTAENQFEGVALAIHHDNITAEVIVSVPSGETIVTTLSVEGIGDLEIREGDNVTACFGADAVILAAVSV